jgi:hypothetical protein
MAFANPGLPYIPSAGDEGSVMHRTLSTKSGEVIAAHSVSTSIASKSRPSMPGGVEDGSNRSAASVKNRPYGFVPDTGAANRQTNTVTAHAELRGATAT